MSRSITFRVRTKDGHHRVDTLFNDSTVAELKSVLLSLTGGKVIDRVLSGYPPTPLLLNDDSLTLDQVQVRSGDTLTVVELAGRDSVRPPLQAVDCQVNHRQGAAAAVGCSAGVTDELNNVTSPSFAAAAAPGLTGSGRPNDEKQHQLKQRDNRATTNNINEEIMTRLLSNGDVTVPAGLLLRRSVPSNNSCLFTSVHFGLSGGNFNLRAGAMLRQIIADSVAADPVTYSEAFLGKPNREYCTWILNEDHWGGAIELAILSKHFRTEIVAVDMQNVRLNRFGEIEDYDTRILLIYDGIHYDPLFLELPDGSGMKTIFPRDDTQILVQALELAHNAKKSGQYVDWNNFTVRCLVCNKGLPNASSVRAHAQSTGHKNFAEV